jgi:hypothetical protein
VTGVRGFTGFRGATGPAGVTGVRGFTGLRGATGLNGPQGIQGVTGAGIQGVTGLTGANGAQGQTGLQGVQGIQGPQGIQGVTGLTGNTGLGGATGISDISGAILFAMFVSTANSVNNKFIDTENIAASNSLPAVAPIADTVTKITFSNQNTTPSGDIEIRVNNTDLGIAADATVTLTGSQTDVFNGSFFTVSEGDLINCYITGAAGVQKPLVKLYI